MEHPSPTTLVFRQWDLSSGPSSSSPSRVLSFSQLLFHVRYALHATPERDVTIVWYVVSQNGKEMRKRILFSPQKFLIIVLGMLRHKQMWPSAWHRVVYDGSWCRVDRHQAAFCKALRYRGKAANKIFEKWRTIHVMALHPTLV
jgi:hypothetical protein